jgi:hypothetical protein
MPNATLTACAAALLATLPATASALDGQRVLRITVMNARTDVSHIDALVDGLEAEAAYVLKHHR